jgi:molybdopterin synthase catalytic subunit
VASGGSAGDVVRVVGVSTAPLDVQAVYDAVAARDAGGVAVFVGVVRDHDEGKAVTALSYSAHPTAEPVMRALVAEVVDAPDLRAAPGEADAAEPVHAVAAVHRVGDLAIGDVAVVVAVACSHRGQAFAVCERLVDEIKAKVPIWKHQRFADGTQEWVGTPG